MQPSFDLRIRTMIKALVETVLPAVDPAKSAAVEQAHLIVASLELLRQQVDYAHWFEVADTRDMAALVEALGSVASLPSSKEGRKLATQCVRAAGRFDVSLAEVREGNRRLRNTITSLAQEAFALEDPNVDGHVRALVLSHSETQVARERAFVAASHFDVYPDNLVPLQEALQREPRLPNPGVLR